MVKKVAQRAIAAGLAGMMSLGAFAPAAMAIDGTTWTTLPWWSLSPTSDDDGLTFWKRIKGDTRYDTMKKILEAAYTSDGRWVNAAEAVVACGDIFPDALAANGLAGTLNQGKGAPVILTKRNALSSQAKEVLEKMQVQHVYIMGGTNTVSQEVEDAIAKMKIATTRVAGSNRQETSMKAFDLVSGNWYKNYGTHSVIIATGRDYADALSIAPFAYQTGTPIVLTKDDGTLTQAQIDSIKDNEEIYNIIVVGGEKSVNPSAFGLVGSFNDKWGFNYTGVRIDGTDRYETSANIADWEVNFAKSAYNRITGKDQGGSTLAYNTGVAVTNVGDCYFDWDFTFVADGQNFPDALAGAQLAGGSYMNARGTGYIAHTNRQGDKEGFISGSPILLTKDGDRTAEMVIAKNLAWNRGGGDKYYKSARALYANWFDLNKAKGTTPGDFVRNYLSLGFFSDGALQSGMTNTMSLTTDWAGDIQSGAFWIVYDGTNVAGFAYRRADKTWVVVDYNGNYVGDIYNGTVIYNGDGLTAGPWKFKRSGSSSLIDVTVDQLKTQVVYDADGNIYGVLNGAADASGAINVDWFGTPNGTYTPATSTYKNGSTTKTAYVSDGFYFYGDQFFGLCNGTRLETYAGKKGTWNAGQNTYVIDGVTYRASWDSPSKTDWNFVNFSKDIYVLDKTVDAQSNFHGIIFGGTASVSKDKAKELDKAVKNSILSDVSAWEWKLGDDYNTILNRTLLGNEFWAYRPGMPESADGAILTDYYAPADITTLTNLSDPVNYTTKLKGYKATDGTFYATRSEAYASKKNIIGAVYTMDFYHYKYGVDAVSRLKDWYYDGTVAVEFVINENTGEIIDFPQF